MAWKWRLLVTPGGWCVVMHSTVLCNTVQWGASELKSVVCADKSPDTRHGGHQPGVTRGSQEDRGRSEDSHGWHGKAQAEVSYPSVEFETGALPAIWQQPLMTSQTVLRVTASIGSCSSRKDKTSLRCWQEREGAGGHWWGDEDPRCQRLVTTGEPQLCSLSASAILWALSSQWAPVLAPAAECPLTHSFTFHRLRSVLTSYQGKWIVLNSFVEVLLNTCIEVFSDISKYCCALGKLPLTIWCMELDKRESNNIRHLLDSSHLKVYTLSIQKRQDFGKIIWTKLVNCNFKPSSRTWNWLDVKIWC